MTTILSGMTIYAADHIISRGEVVVEKNKIKSLGLPAPHQLDTEHVFTFPEDYSLVPGFIDLHVHGAKGADVMDGSIAAFRAISQALAEEGTTSFLATTMTAGAEEIEKTLTIANEFVNAKNPEGATCLGVHLEGPFISADKLGAQRADHIQNPDISLIKKWQMLSGNLIKLVTLAPELTQASELVEYLVTENIIASIGHTNASYATTKAAIQAGCKHATHIFNAMSGIHHRVPGAVTAALLADDLFAEMIVDGVHLHPAIVELLVKVKGIEKLLLVTDAMRAKCLCDGHYDLAGQQVQLQHNEVRLPNGALAGSVLKMSDAIKNVMEFAGCRLQDAIKMASENPARALNIFHEKGSIAQGKDADLVVLDPSLNVVLTMSRGTVAWIRQGAVLA